MDGELILFPHYQELKNTVEKLRTELSMLVLERDDPPAFSKRNFCWFIAESK